MGSLLFRLLCVSIPTGPEVMTCLYSVQIYPSVVVVGIIYYLSCPNLSLYLSSRLPMLYRFNHNDHPTPHDPTPQLLPITPPHHNHHHHNTTTTLGLAVWFTSLPATQPTPNVNHWKVLAGMHQQHHQTRPPHLGGVLTSSSTYYSCI